jgi:hypothetical protein
MRCLLPATPTTLWPWHAARRTPQRKGASSASLHVMHSKEATDYMMELLNK